MHLRLYVTGRTASAQRARNAMTEVECHVIANHGRTAVVLEVIDVLETPEAAARDGVFATPTLVRLSPQPTLKLFGDLSSADGILESLEITVSAGVRKPAVAASAPSSEDKAPWVRPHPPGTSSLRAAVPD
jgi:circadian clock protein KaiB